MNEIINFFGQQASIKQFDHILVAFAVAWEAIGRRGVGMGKIIDQHQLGAARQDGIKIHLGAHSPIIVKATVGNAFNVGQQRLQFGATVGFDSADHHCNTLGGAVQAAKQHGIGFADTRGHAQKDF